jgi:hypothetical protein
MGPLAVADDLLQRLTDDTLHLLASRRPPVGRLFPPRAEKALRPDLIRLASTLTTPGSVVLAVEEFVGPFGVADLVAVVTSVGRLESRWAAGIPPLLSSIDAAIVAAIDEGAAQTTEELDRVLGCSEGLVPRRVARLLRHGALLRDGASLARHPAITPLGELHAFEAKVTEWGRGLGQARRYGLWSDQATIVLPRLPRSPGRLDTAVTRWGIGLAVGGKWRHRPAVITHTPEQRLWASEHAVAALFGPMREQRRATSPHRQCGGSGPRQAALPIATDPQQVAR